MTALLLAAHNGHTSVVELLLNKGANINHKNKESYRERISSKQSYSYFITLTVTYLTNTFRINLCRYFLGYNDCTSFSLRERTHLCCEVPVRKGGKHGSREYGKLNSSLLDGSKY